MVRQMLTLPERRGRIQRRAISCAMRGCRSTILALTMQAFHGLDLSARSATIIRLLTGRRCSLQTGGFLRKHHDDRETRQPQCKTIYPKSNGWPTGRIVKELKDRNAYPQGEKYLPRRHAHLGFSGADARRSSR